MSSVTVEARGDELVVTLTMEEAAKYRRVRVVVEEVLAEVKLRPEQPEGDPGEQGEKGEKTGEPERTRPEGHVRAEVKQVEGLLEQAERARPAETAPKTMGNKRTYQGERGTVKR